MKNYNLKKSKLSNVCVVKLKARREDVEFIMGLEEHFKITIPDSDAPKFFQEFTLQDAVKYIQSKLQDTD